ncbi:MAG: hypothetical protein AB8G22_15025 [Saprospiraceae bacterium]
MNPLSTFTADQYLKYVTVFLFFTSLLLSSCVKEQYFIDTEIPRVAVSDTTDIVTYCPLSDCDIVFEETRRIYQTQANQLQQVLFIPVKCCFEGHINHVLFKVAPKILTDDNYAQM